MSKFCCILILHFCTEFSRVFNFAILSYSRNLQKFHACENNVVYWFIVLVAVTIAVTGTMLW